MNLFIKKQSDKKITKSKETIKKEKEKIKEEKQKQFNKKIDNNKILRKLFKPKQRENRCNSLFISIICFKWWKKLY